MSDNDMNAPVFRIRKRVVYLVAVVIALALGTILAMTVFPPRQNSKQAEAGSSLGIGKHAPDFTLATLDGGKASLSPFRGHPVLINFWASWCVPCREEMPELVRAYKAHKAEGLVILGVNLTHEDTLSDAQAFAKEFNITFPVLLDEDGTVSGKQYIIQGIPTSIFIARDGTIARVQVGQMTGQQIDQYVAEILK